MIPREARNWPDKSFQTETTYPYERISSLISDTSYLGEFSGGDRIYAVTAVDSSGRESGFSQFIFAPGLVIPSGVAPH